MAFNPFSGVNLSNGFNPINVVKAQIKNVQDPNIDLIPAWNNPFNDAPTSGVLGASTTNNRTQPRHRDDSGAGTPPSSTPYSEADRQAASDAQERANTLFGIDTSLGSAQNALGRLDGQLSTGYGNIDRDYSHELEILTGNRTANLDRYKKQEVSQLNEYGAKRTNNNQAAAGWLRGAQSTLGANGAGGGSAARFALPFEAQTQATRANSADQATNNANMSAIAGSRNRDEVEFNNAQSDLDYQRTQGRNDYLSKIQQQRADLTNTIGGLSGQRAIAQGGDINAAKNAANPYTSKIDAILAQIDGLAATPAIKARQVATGQADLSGYNWARPETAPVAQQDPTLGGGQVYQPYDDDQVNPILSLFGLDDRRQYA